ncbi:MAG: hypothetical protein HY093_01575 [Candidatus Liptonbacteria bacterium]|nr:hypothetical protein [Candidatus Liptonbacteria bacterium]
MLIYKKSLLAHPKTKLFQAIPNFVDIISFQMYVNYVLVGASPVQLRNS